MESFSSTRPLSTDPPEPTSTPPNLSSRLRPFTMASPVVKFEPHMRPSATVSVPPPARPDWADVSKAPFPYTMAHDMIILEHTIKLKAHIEVTGRRLPKYEIIKSMIIDNLIPANQPAPSTRGIASRMCRLVHDFRDNIIKKNDKRASFLKTIINDIDKHEDKTLGGRAANDRAPPQSKRRWNSALLSSPMTKRTRFECKRQIPGTASCLSPRPSSPHSSSPRLSTAVVLPQTDTTGVDQRQNETQREASVCRGEPYEQQLQPQLLSREQRQPHQKQEKHETHEKHQPDEQHAQRYEKQTREQQQKQDSESDAEDHEGEDSESANGEEDEGSDNKYSVSTRVALAKLRFKSQELSAHNAERERAFRADESRKKRIFQAEELEKQRAFDMEQEERKRMHELKLVERRTDGKMFEEQEKRIENEARRQERKLLAEMFSVLAAKLGN